MQRMMRLALPLILVLTSAPLIQAAAYSFTTFNPAGLTGSTATGINNQGQVSGFGSGPTSLQGFVYDHGASTVFSAPYSSDNVTRATGINNSGVVVGMAIAFDGYSTYPNSGFVYDLGTFTNDAYYGAPSGSLSGINDAGEIVGRNSRGDSFFRDQSGINHVLSGPPGTTALYLSSINNSEEIGGTNNSNFAASSQAFIYHSGVYTVLPGQYGSVMAINNLGQALVSLLDGAYGVLDPDGTFTPLILPASFFQTDAYGLNDAGQIVGSTFVRGSPESFAFVASPTAIPEPTNLVLAGIGLAILLTSRELRRRLHSPTFAAR